MRGFFQQYHLGPPETPRTPGLATAYVWLFVSVGLITLARIVEEVWLDGTFSITQVLVAVILLTAVAVFARKWRRTQDHLRRAGLTRRSRKW